MPSCLLKSCSALVWAVSMVYIHMHYIGGWLISLCTYLAVYAEIMFLLFYYYGHRLLNQGAVLSRIDCVYYFLTFGSFIGCSIFAIRTHELTDRQNFHAKYRQRQETEEWKRMLRDIPEPVILTLRGSVIFFNRATLEFFGMNPAAPGAVELPLANGQEDSSLKNALLARAVLAQLDSIRKHKNRVSLLDIIENESQKAMDEDMFVYTRQGRKRHITIKCVKIFIGTGSDDRIVEYIFHDVTMLKDLEREKVKEDCFDILLATASHDIRTPLNAILGAADILEEHVDTPLEKAQLNVVRACGQKMLYYLKSLSFIREINTGLLCVTKRSFNPSEVAKSVVGTLEFGSQIRGLSLGFSVSPGVPRNVLSDKEMYSIILQNLLENSIKYTFVGGIKISINFNPATHHLCTTVTDTGIGMTAQQQKNLGTLFKKPRGTQGNKLNPQGLGFGMFLVKTLVQKLDGELLVKSAEKSGTSITFTAFCGAPPPECRLSGGDESGDSPVAEERVPLAFTHAMTEAGAERAPILKFSHNPRPHAVPFPVPYRCLCSKVLLVDDDPFSLNVLVEYLASIHVKADKAENGQLAIEMIEGKSDMQECCRGYSVVFMDINMPVMDGIEATERILELSRAGKIPKCFVVAVTAAIDLDKPDVYASYIAKGFAELCIDGT